MQKDKTKCNANKVQSQKLSNVGLSSDGRLKLSRPSLCFRMHVKPLVLVAFTVVSATNPFWASVVGILAYKARTLPKRRRGERRVFTK
jgi:hypothetical protein